VQLIQSELTAAPTGPFEASERRYRPAWPSVVGHRHALPGTPSAVKSAKYKGWRDGTADAPKFGSRSTSSGMTKQPPRSRRLFPGSVLFGANPDGVVRDLHEQLCRFTRGHPSRHTNVAIWMGSNIPIFVPDAFTKFQRDFRDTFLACFILLKLAYPRLKPPVALPKVASNC
jgi:hypothetical protein